MFNLNIKRTVIDIYPTGIPNDNTYIIRHYDGNDRCVAEQYLTEEQATQAQENNPAIKTKWHG